MLVLTRKKGQSIMLNDDIEISILEVQGEQVRIGINAPRDVKIFRKEIFEEIQDENKIAAGTEKSSMDNLIKKQKNKENIKKEKLESSKKKVITSNEENSIENNKENN